MCRGHGRDGERLKDLTGAVSISCQLNPVVGTRMVDNVSNAMMTRTRLNQESGKRGIPKVETIGLHWVVIEREVCGENTA